VKSSFTYSNEPPDAMNAGKLSRGCTTGDPLSGAQFHKTFSYCPVVTLWVKVYLDYMTSFLVGTIRL
jgi:hypothetical protein